VFWPRLENFPSFVLSELQPILFVVQNRLEMGASRQIRREKLIADMRLWPRVEMTRSFVLSELRRILHIEQNRVEMRPGSSKLRAYLWLGSSAGVRAGRRAELRLGEALDDIQF
jgi:hypothetical protein